MTRRFAIICMLSVMVSAGASSADEHALEPTFVIGGSSSKRASVYDTLIFHARIGKPFYVGDITDFRLERLGKESAVIPLLFFWKDSDYRYDTGAEIDGIRLHLRDPRWHREVDQAKVQGLRVATEDRTIDLHATAMFAPGERYRLTWTGRPVDGEAMPRACEFRTRGVMADNENPKRPPERSRYTYLCEMLARDRDGNLFLAHDVIPNRSGEFGLLGYDSDGKLAEAPFGGFRRFRSTSNLLASAIPGKNLGPLVASTGYVDFSIHGESVRIGGANVCEPRSAPLPQDPEDVTHFFGARGIGRIRVLSENIVALREDRTFWEMKTAEIAEGMRCHLQNKYSAIADIPRRELCLLAGMSCHREVLGEVSRRLRVWADSDETRFPYGEAYAVALAGDERALRTLRYVHARRPDAARHLASPALQMARRSGWNTAGGNLIALLTNKTPARHGLVETLRRHNASIPTQTQGDQVLVELVKALRLEPHGLGLQLAEAQLLALDPDKLRLPAETRKHHQQKIKHGGGTWFFPDEESRSKGYVSMVRALETHFSEGERDQPDSKRR